MPSPLLTTKLYIPPTRPGMVLRPRLVRRLDEGLRLGRKLTLISAPADFGKTTLLSEWINQTGTKKTATLARPFVTRWPLRITGKRAASS